MKAEDVNVGDVYAVKVSGSIAPVVIDEEHPNGGWVGTNQETNRQVRIKTARRLRMPWEEYLNGGDGDEAEADLSACLSACDAQASLSACDAQAGNAQAGTAPQGAEEPEGEPEAEEPKKRATRAKGGLPAAPAAQAGDEKTTMSGLDAAAKVLAEAGEPLNCKAIVERAFEAGYWQSDGKTPAATVYAAILREIQKRGDDSRFRKAGRGLFALAE